MSNNFFFRFYHLTIIFFNFISCFFSRSLECKLSSIILMMLEQQKKSQNNKKRENQIIVPSCISPSFFLSLIRSAVFKYLWVQLEEIIAFQKAEIEISSVANKINTHTKLIEFHHLLEHNQKIIIYERKSCNTVLTSVQINWIIFHLFLVMPAILSIHCLSATHFSHASRSQLETKNFTAKKYNIFAKLLNLNTTIIYLIWEVCLSGHAHLIWASLNLKINKNWRQ